MKDLDLFTIYLGDSWGYPPPTNNEIIICSFLLRALYKPSLSTVSGPGIPPTCNHFIV